jgi:hypothetical protein
MPSSERPAFPRLRWLALAWMLVWLPSYLFGYGPAVLLNLCDVAVILSCVGLWTGSALLVSSQAVSSLLVDVAWDLDLLVRAATGTHIVGGTEYMWDPAYPLALRLLSLFHVWLPPVLLHALRRLGYDRRAFKLQAAIAVAVLVASRLLTRAADNQNFAWRDPFLDRPLGPAPVHLAVIALTLIGLLYWPTHRLLARVFGTVQPSPAPPSPTRRTTREGP